MLFILFRIYDSDQKARKEKIFNKIFIKRSIILEVIEGNFLKTFLNEAFNLYLSFCITEASLKAKLNFINQPVRQ